MKCTQYRFFEVPKNFAASSADITSLGWARRQLRLPIRQQVYLRQHMPKRACSAVYTAGSAATRCIGEQHRIPQPFGRLDSEQPFAVALTDRHGHCDAGRLEIGEHIQLG